MASKIGLGVPMPMMLPVTGLWTAPFAAYYLFLQNRIVYHRLSNKAYVVAFSHFLLINFGL